MKLNYSFWLLNVDSTEHSFSNQIEWAVCENMNGFLLKLARGQTFINNCILTVFRKRNDGGSKQHFETDGDIHLEPTNNCLAGMYQVFFFFSDYIPSLYNKHNVFFHS